MQKNQADKFLPGWNDVGWLLVLALVCSVIAFQLSANALKKLSAFTVNLTYNLEPVYGIILAFIVYHENKFLSQWFFIGFGIIAIALVVHVYMLLKEEKRIVHAEK
jgi:drug/metabolite transporter (DMT)-like permease